MGTDKLFLVTGGEGFLGSALVNGLLAAGARVRSLDNSSRAGRTAALADHPRLQRIQADIRDSRAVADAVRGVDSICHLAYINGTEFFYKNPDTVLDVAVKGMVNVIDAAMAEGVKDLVLASSSEVYQTAPVVPTPEEVPLIVPDVNNPRYSYGGGKIICELMAINYGRRHFDRSVIFRPHNVYGPNMGREHVVPQFALRMKELFAWQPSGVVDFPIQGDGRETRAFVFIDDFTDALVRVVLGGGHLEVYHIGTEEEVSIAHLARKVAACFGREIRLVPGELPAGATLRRCPDITKVRSLGYSPRITLEAGLARTVDWYVNHA